MATCKECIHYEMCSGFTPTDLDQDVFDYCRKGITDEIPDIEERCTSFKDKSRYIELPCKVGDMVYRVSFVHKNVIPLNVEGFIRNLASWKAHCTHLIPTWVGNQKEHIYISFSSFGKTVFLTKEEAEKALAERKQK